MSGEPVEIFFQEKYRRLDHLDSFVQRLEQEGLSVAKNGERATILTAKRADTPVTMLWSGGFSWNGMIGMLRVKP